MAWRRRKPPYLNGSGFSSALESLTLVSRILQRVGEVLLPWLDSLHGVGWLGPLSLGQCVWRFARLAQDSGRAVRR